MHCTFNMYCTQNTLHLKNSNSYFITNGFVFKNEIINIFDHWHYFMLKKNFHIGDFFTIYLYDIFKLSDVQYVVIMQQKIHSYNQCCAKIIKNLSRYKKITKKKLLITKMWNQYKKTLCVLFV